MALPEGYLPREDDVLTLTATVQRDAKEGDDDVYVKIDGHYSGMLIDMKDVSLQRRGWHVDEKVWFKDSTGGAPATVLGVSGDHIWVSSAPGSPPITCHANDLVPWVDTADLKLEVDEAAVEAMKEPPPAPPLPGGEDAPKPADPADDDDMPF